MSFDLHSRDCGVRPQEQQQGACQKMGLFGRTDGCKKGISLFLFLCSSQIVGASQINEVYVALEEISGNLPDNFTFTFASSNPLAEVTEIAATLPRN